MLKSYERLHERTRNVTSWEGLSACRIALYIYIHIHNIYILTICLLCCLFCPFSDLHITTNVESSNPSHGEVYLIQHDVIKFVIVTCHRSLVFSGYTGFCYQYNLRHDITEILMVVSGLKHHNPNHFFDLWHLITQSDDQN